MALQDPDPASPEPTIADWRRLVEAGRAAGKTATSQSATRDGLVIEPLYVGMGGSPPLPGRGSRPWLIVQVIDDPDLDAANQHASAAIAGGATSLALRFALDTATGRGLPPTREALLAVLEGVDPASVQIRLEPCRKSVGLARALVDMVRQRGIASERASIAFGLDLLAAGAWLQALDLHVDCFAELREAGYRGPLVNLDARPVHEAGGSEAQELAAVLASAACWLRGLQCLGINAAAALPFFGASVNTDRDQWLSIAKLRALRLLWARLLEICGAPPQRLMVHAETSRRMMTRADAHANIMRTTIATFAAAIAGADSIAVLPFTEALGSSDAHAHALARNTQHLLLEESQLYRVDDPAAGSGAVEAMSAALAASAWDAFQTLEREGGLLESLKAGAFQARIAEAREALRAELAGGTPLVGATIYRAAGIDPPAEPAEPTEAASGALAPVRLEQLAAAHI